MDDNGKAYREAMEFVNDFLEENGFNANGNTPPTEAELDRCIKQRKESIKTIKEMQGKLDRVCVRANYGKVVGNGAEIVGAAGAIGGVILSVAGVDAGRAITDIGNLINDAGVLVDEISTLVESLFSASYLGKVDEILKKDKELCEKIFRPLQQWLPYMHGLDENVRALFKVSLADEKFFQKLKVLHAFCCISITTRNFNAAVTHMREGKHSLDIDWAVEMKTFSRLFAELSVCPKFAEKFANSLCVLSTGAFGIAFLIQGYRLCCRVWGTSSYADQTVQGGVPSRVEASLFVLFRAICLATKVRAAINAASIIRHGKSRYNEALAQIILSLKHELTQMETLKEQIIK